ncbi:MAG TPA: hypothetical protein VLT32_20500 [Candidatus Sulfomarinibacteraceae bacterium]|nr:hypothetical protein [Candidatus Sulfomarinibacteraceae bacterium]
MKTRLEVVVFVIACLVAAMPVIAQESTTVQSEVAAELAAAAAWNASPVYGNPPSTATLREPDVTVFFSNFDSDNGGLSGTRDWEWGTSYAWSVSGCDSTPAPPAGPYSGGGMWATVLNTCHNNLGNNQGAASGTCNNTNPSDDSILSLTVDLSAYTAATVTWYEWLDVFSYFDWTEVRVNSTSVSTYCPSAYAAPTGWIQQAVDLTPYVGGIVTVEWHFMSSTVVNRAGWYIDDVLVDGTPVPVELQTFSVD